jgi:type VI secretion system lysozyme-like protein
MAELVRGAPVPLFDRLSLVGAVSESRHQLLSATQLQDSIGRSLHSLLNTRSRLGPSEFSSSTGTTLDYGIPDISALSAVASPDLELLESTVAQAISYYEPRLKNVIAKAFPASQPAGGALLLISGTVTIDLKLRQFNFELQLAQQQTRVKAL